MESFFVSVVGNNARIVEYPENVPEESLWQANEISTSELWSIFQNSRTEDFRFLRKSHNYLVFSDFSGEKDASSYYQLFRDIQEGYSIYLCSRVTIMERIASNQ